VDDILIIYDSRHTDIKNIQEDFNTLHPNMKFTAEPESNNELNFSDITIHKTPTKWTTSIYRKPSFTDGIIPYSSNHPPQHKHAGIRYLHNRLNTYHLQHEEYKEELDTIHDIMQNKGFPIHTHIHPTPRQPTMTSSQKAGKTAHKWAHTVVFDYITFSKFHTNNENDTLPSDVVRVTHVFFLKNIFGSYLCFPLQTKYNRTGTVNIT